MKLFMTSSPGGSVWEEGKRSGAPLDNRNGFEDKLREVCPKGARCLILSSDPENTEMNDEMCAIMEEAFALSRIFVCAVDVCDARNKDAVGEMLWDYEILILAGGHVPTENAFYQEIGLKKLMNQYRGIVIGISAGTMNCADVVYASPEEEGEAVDPDYKRYLQGLGLTSISVLPHFQEIRHWMLDGLRIFEDICIPDSRVRPFYALPDGSYFYKENGKTILCGEAWLLKDGTCTKVCENGNVLEVEDER